MKSKPAVAVDEKSIIPRLYRSRIVSFSISSSLIASSPALQLIFDLYL